MRSLGARHASAPPPSRAVCPRSFNVCGRYLVVLYYQQTKMQKRQDTAREMQELAEMRARLGIDEGDGNLDLTSK